MALFFTCLTTAQTKLSRTWLKNGSFASLVIGPGRNLPSKSLSIHNLSERAGEGITEKSAKKVVSAGQGKIPESAIDPLINEPRKNWHLGTQVVMMEYGIRCECERSHRHHGEFLSPSIS